VFRLIGSRKDGLYVYYELTDLSMLAIIDVIRRGEGGQRPAPRVKPRRVKGCDCPQCSVAPTSKGRGEWQKHHSGTKGD
jgi:hypothetical protein